MLLREKTEVEIWKTQHNCINFRYPLKFTFISSFKIRYLLILFTIKKESYVNKRKFSRK